MRSPCIKKFVFLGKVNLANEVFLVSLQILSVYTFEQFLCVIVNGSVSIRKRGGVFQEGVYTFEQFLCVIINGSVSIVMS